MKHHHASALSHFDGHLTPGSFVREPVVCAFTGLHRVTVRRHVKLGIFPPPYKIGRAAVAWKSSDLLAWAEARHVST